MDTHKGINNHDVYRFLFDKVHDVVQVIRISEPDVFIYKRMKPSASIRIEQMEAIVVFTYAHLLVDVQDLCLDAGSDTHPHPGALSCTN